MPDAPPRPTYVLTVRLFLGALAAVYAVAFVSLWVQVDGLVGPAGILPAARYLELARRQLGPAGWQRLPTIFWWTGADPAVLHVACAAGVALSALVAVGVAPGPLLVLLWLDYLSLAVVGQVFLNFQWDALLLETGLLAAFVAPWRLRPALARAAAPPAPALWLLRFLLFKLMFMSGLVKLASGDPTWWGLTALQYHYWTTCLPVWIGWYLHQLPAWVQTVSTAGMFVVELLVPFGIFGPRPVRLLTFVPLVLFQAFICLTGNYGFFNLLTVALCILLLDDAALRALAPRRLRDRLPVPLPLPPAGPRWLVAVALALPLAALSVTTVVMRFFGPGAVPAPLMAALRAVAPLRSVNGYGLFARMTTTRPEIVVEGSNDGHTWLPYEFRWKPGDPTRRPAFVEPHMPRLDWQMWFAALQGVEYTPWFEPFLRRLLEGSPAVLALLGQNPFPDAPPRFVRAVLYDYRFTDRATRATDGTWWRRTPLGLYAPVLSGG